MDTRRPIDRLNFRELLTAAGSSRVFVTLEWNPMTLPILNANGDLPPGVHLSTLKELETRFGASNTIRILMFQRLERIFAVAKRTGHLGRFVIYGSFVTDKIDPNDVDVFMVFDDDFDASQADPEARLLLDHATADAHFGARVFWLRRPAAFGGEQAKIEFWQTKRDGGIRGIVEIGDFEHDQK